MGLKSDYNEEKNGKMNTKKPFELFLGCLGNGITVCNKAVMQSGDYKAIAHISDNGKISWYIADPESYVPAPELERIKRCAKNQKDKWEKWFSSLSEINQYMFLMERIKITDFLSITGQKTLSMSEKITLAKECFDQI